MKNIKIPVHSFVDFITNSSTETFIGVHGKSIEIAKSIINEILKLSGTEKTADDLFEFMINKFDINCDDNCWFYMYKI